MGIATCLEGKDTQNIAKNRKPQCISSKPKTEIKVITDKALVVFRISLFCYFIFIHLNLFYSVSKVLSIS